MLSDRIRKIGIREVARRLNWPLTSVSQYANGPKKIKAKDLGVLGEATGLKFSVTVRTSIAKERARRTPGNLKGVWGNKVKHRANKLQSVIEYSPKIKAR